MAIPSPVTHTRQRVGSRGGSATDQILARSLASGRTNVVGIIHPLSPINDLADPMFMQIVGGMAEALEERQMDLIMAPVSPSMNCAPTNTWSKSVGRWLLWSRILICTTNGSPIWQNKVCLSSPTVALASMNHTLLIMTMKLGCAIAVEHLLAHGHQRIGLISAPARYEFLRVNVSQSFGKPCKRRV